MTTERIYRQNQYETECTTAVTEVRSKNGCDVIACASSVFYPEGGGQPSDSGTVSRGEDLYEVTSAHDDSLEGAVWHYTDAPEGTFAPGDEVTLTIDWDKRFGNMQRHLGEHMLSGTMDSLFGGVNKGFHMGEDYVTIDIDLDGRMLTADELDLAERTVNEAVWADLPVTVTWFEDYDASKVMPVRKAVPHDGRVSVVTVGDLPDPYDCIACCGTHPSSSGQVGLVAIYKCEANKGMNRIYFDCGKAALDHLSEESKILADISRKHSCKPKDLPQRLEKEAESVSELRGRLSALAAYAAAQEKISILEGIAAQESAVYEYSSEIFSTDELLKLGFSAAAETQGKLLILMQPAAKTCLLISSGEAKCGKLVKEYAPAYNGKGGGRDDNARAMFADESDMKAFASALSEVVK